MTSTLYLRCSPGDVGSRVLLSGDPARVDRIGSLLDDARVVSRNREYSIITGVYKDCRVSAVSAGIGAPSTAIALEELKQVGARAVVRVGTMMGISAPMGTLVVPTGAVRYEGTSLRYLPIQFPAVPDWKLVQALNKSGRMAGLEVQLGVSATYDAFYPDMAPSLVADHPSPDWKPLRRAGVLSLDMESALLFVAGRVLGLAVATMCLVTVKAGPPPEFMDQNRRANLDRRLVEAALGGLVTFQLEG
ncbi:MAG: nucleoside phosphorylase [Anaerolineae bacterium]